MYTLKESMKGVSHPAISASKAILPPLNQKVQTTLADHEKQILGIFTSYTAAFAAQNSIHLGEDNKLPLPKLKHLRSGEGVGSEFQQHLEQNSTPIVIHSPFMTNSSHGNIFHSISELATSLHPSTNLNKHTQLLWSPSLHLERGQGQVHAEHLHLQLLQAWVSINTCNFKWHPKGYIW
jgi:hypothetical protein